MMFGMAPMGLVWWMSGLLVVVLLAAACLASLSHLPLPRRRSAERTDDAAVELLRHRLATGEIDDEEYLSRRSALGD